MKYFVFIFRQWIDHGFYLFSCSGNELIMDFICFHVLANSSWILYVFMFRQWVDHGFICFHVQAMGRSWILYVFMFRQWVDHGFYMFACLGNGLIMDFICFHV